jgi:hypothetical protein
LVGAVVALILISSMSHRGRNTKSGNSEGEFAKDLAHDEDDDDNQEDLDDADEGDEFDEDTDEDDLDDDEDLDDELERNSASRFKRFVHFVVDQLAGGLIARFVFSGISHGGRGMGKVEMVLWCMLIFVCYCLFFEAVFQRTPAKMLTGTRVVGENGERADLGQLVKRTLARLVPLDSVSFMFGNDWHDRWSGTRVINTVARD